MERMNCLHRVPYLAVLLVLLLLAQRSAAQPEHHRGMHVRGSAGAALVTFPELSDLARNQQATYESPGLTPSVGLSAIVWANEHVGLTLALEYDWLKTSYHWEPEHPDFQTVGWEIEGFTAMVGGEYWLPVQWSSATPFLGISAGASAGHIKRTGNGAFYFPERDPTLHDLDNAHSYALAARAGFAFPVSGNLALLVSAEYRRTGNLWTLDGGKAGPVDMYVSGFKFLLSVQI